MSSHHSDSPRSLAPVLRTVGLLICLAASGCASSGRKVVHTARMSDSSAPPALSIYKNRGDSAIVYGSAFMFGMPGLLISSMSVGKAQNRELGKWRGTENAQSELILQIMNQRFQAAMERSGKLKFPKTGEVDIVIKFREMAYGIRYKGKDRFTLVVRAKVVFPKGQDDEFYDFGEELESSTPHTAEQYARDPECFRRAVTEIADKFAALVAEDYGLPSE